MVNNCSFNLFQIIMMWIMFWVLSLWCHLNQKIWSVLLHKWNKLELTCMSCSWVAEFEQKQIFLLLYIPLKIFRLGFPTIHVYEMRFYLPTELFKLQFSWINVSNLELAATGSPAKLLHSTVQESQYHSISVLVWTAARYACLDIRINGNHILLMLYYHYIK